MIEGITIEGITINFVLFVSGIVVTVGLIVLAHQLNDLFNLAIDFRINEGDADYIKEKISIYKTLLNNFMLMSIASFAGSWAVITKFPEEQQLVEWLVMLGMSSVGLWLMMVYLLLALLRQLKPEKNGHQTISDRFKKIKARLSTAKK